MLHWWCLKTTNLVNRYDTANKDDFVMTNPNNYAYVTHKCRREMGLKHVNGTHKQKMNTKFVTFRKTAIRSGGGGGAFSYH